MIKKPAICHLTSVHTVYDTRIFYKECLSLTQKYIVYLIAPHTRQEFKDGVSIIPINPVKNKLLRLLLGPLQVLLKAIPLKAKIYHLHDPELIPAGMLLRLLGKKVIYDVHENVKADIQEKEWLPLKGLFSLAFSLMESLACRYFYIILANEAYVPYFDKKKADHTLVQNFVPQEIFAPLRKPYNKGADTLLFVGMLSARRGLPWLLEALLILKTRGMIIRLKCIGHYNSTVEQILRASEAYTQVREQVEFKGYMPVKEAYAQAADCMAGVALLEDLENNRYNYPTKLFEYMAVGLPVICSNFEVNREVLDNCKCGLAVDPQITEQIASAIAYIYMHRHEAATMAANGITASQKYSWESEETRLLQLYERIMD